MEQYICLKLIEAPQPWSHRLLVWLHLRKKVVLPPPDKCKLPAGHKRTEHSPWGLMGDERTLKGRQLAWHHAEKLAEFFEARGFKATIPDERAAIALTVSRPDLDDPIPVIAVLEQPKDSGFGKLVVMVNEEGKITPQLGASWEPVRAMLVEGGLSAQIADGTPPALDSNSPSLPSHDAVSAAK